MNLILLSCKKIISSSWLFISLFSVKLEFDAHRHQCCCCCCYNGDGGGVSIRFIVVFYLALLFVYLVCWYCHSVCGLFVLVFLFLATIWHSKSSVIIPTTVRNNGCKANSKRLVKFNFQADISNFTAERRF